MNIRPSLNPFLQTTSSQPVLEGRSCTFSSKVVTFKSFISQHNLTEKPHNLGMEVSFYKSLHKAIVQGSFIAKFMNISKLFSIDG